MAEWFMREVTPEQERDIADYMARLAAAPTAAVPGVADLDLLMLKASLLSECFRSSMNTLASRSRTLSPEHCGKASLSAWPITQS